MAMVVQHNIAAQLALGELNKNNDNLRKSLEKVSSGQKINSAKDDSANFCISEKMREQIRSLDQDNQNVQNGSALFKIADGGINSIVDELRNLKELAINAANDTNTDEDRKIMQKEFFQRYTNINDIATETNYNGKRLLDGTYAKMVIVGKDVRESSEIIGWNTRDVTYTKTSITKVRQSDGVISVRENNNNKDLVTNFSAIDSAVTKVSSPRSGRSIVCDVGFAGASNGSWTYSPATRAYSYIPSSNSWNWARATLGTKVNSFQNLTTGAAGAINANSQTGVSMDFNLISNDISDLDREGFSIMCGGCYQYINIVFDASLNNSDSTFTRSQTDSNRSDYVIGIADIGTATADTLSEAIFNGIQASNNGYDSYDISSGTTVLSVLVDPNHDVRVALNPNYDANDSSKGTKYIFTKDSSPDMDFIGSGIMVAAADPQSIQGNEVTQTVSQNYTETVSEPIYKYEHYETDIYGQNDKPLIIHHGPRANLKTHFFISNMHTKFLGSDDIYIDDATLPPYDRIVNAQDRERYDALSYDEKKQAEWLDTLKLANNKNLDQISVTTKQNANIAIRVIDGAIEDAVNEATQMGAYLQRLEYTGANVVTMGENVQAAESTIRDADMAKEMTTYTKNNVLVQSAQSMLAQANQNGSAVLSLLQ